MKVILILFLLTYCSIWKLKSSPIDYSFLPYSGKVSVDGINLNGTVKFTFSIIEKNGVVHWKSSSTNTPIQIEVSNGRYLALLGGQGMPTLPTDLFLLEAELYLKVMADLGDGIGLRHLAPDQLLTSTPHALSAEVARRLLPGSVSFESFTPELRKTFEETLSEHLSPKIIAQPENLMPVEGEEIDYSIEVEGYSLKYQWTKDGVVLPNQKENSLSIESYSPDDHDGIYRLEVSNEFGVIKTREFMIGISITTDWEISFDHTLNDVIPTAEGGWLVGGSTHSIESSDLFISKINSNGKTLWSKTFSAGGHDTLAGISPSPDGGYLLLASSTSNRSGDKSGDSRGANDYWLIKIDESGNKLWDKTYGGDLDDEAIFISPAHGSGYLLGGRSYSSKSHEKSEDNIKPSDHLDTNTSYTTEELNSIDSDFEDEDYYYDDHFGYDYWVIRIDETGSILWDRTLGSSGDDWINSITLSKDGGYIITGDSDGPADGNKTQEHIGGIWDFWIIKVDGQGNKVWDATLGGTEDDEWPVINAVDDGFVAIGTSDSNISGHVSDERIGGRDLWMVKIDENGEKIWDRKFGKTGTSSEWHYPRVVSSGKSLFITSYLDDRAGDTWLVKTDGDGRLLTEKRLSYDFHAPKFVLSSDRKEAVLFGGSALEVESKSLLVKLIVDQEFLLDEIISESDEGIPGGGGGGGTPQPTSIPDGSITIAKLSEKVIQELRKTITKEMLSTQILLELNRTITIQDLDSQVVDLLNKTVTTETPEQENNLNDTTGTQTNAGTSIDSYPEALVAYLRPTLTGGIWKSWGIEGLPVSLRAPTVDGRFLTYQWYKNGAIISGADSEEFVISEFNATRDAGEYEIHIANDFATLKTKAVLIAGVGILDGTRIAISEYIADPISESHSVFLKSHGGVEVSGSNAFGLVGNGTFNPSLSPDRSLFSNGNLSINIKEISSGSKHAIYLLDDGTVYGVGDNEFGQLGSAIDIPQNFLSVITGVTEVVQISAGPEHSVFLKSDGTILTTGKNEYGQLGIGTTENRNSPTLIAGISGVTQVSAGWGHTMFIKSDGTLWGMGHNLEGQLGDGTNDNRNSPVQVSGVSDVKLVSTDYHTMFIKNDGTLWGMGYNLEGQLGDGTKINRSIPVRITGFTDIVDVSAGYSHTMFVREDGSLWTMGGTGNYNLLGSVYYAPVTTPVQVAGVTDVVRVYAGSTFSLFTKRDGSIWAMGDNADGQFGNGSIISSTSPVQVGSLLAMEEQPFVPEGAADVLVEESTGTDGPSFDPADPAPMLTVASAANLEMIWVEPGTFTMVSPSYPDSDGIIVGGNEVQTAINEGFYLGTFEVTQNEYQAVITGNTHGLSATPSQWPNNPNRPVEKVSWNDISVFLSILNNSESTRLPTGWAYALPTEAEWEYACKAGTTSAYSWGDSISSQNANFDESGIAQTRDVGSYMPNPWGFYDMHGNVSEFVGELFRPDDLVDDDGGLGRGIRGGSWYTPKDYLRSSREYYTGEGSDDLRVFELGFRLALRKIN